MEERPKMVLYTEMASPIGPITLASTNKGVCWIDFGKSDETINSLRIWSKRWLNTDKIQRDDMGLQEIVRQLNEYFNGDRKKFEITVDLYGTPFQKIVWESLLEIPYGEVKSYKHIAMQINAPKAVRAIGGANHNNPVPIIVPCHRVIGSNGNLVGYGGGLKIKEHLLKLEGYSS